MSCEIVVVRRKVGQGQPFNQGCNNEIHSHNCYNLSSLRTEVVLKAYEELQAPHLSQLNRIITYFINKRK